MRPSQTFHVLETLRKSSVAPLYRKGVLLSQDDTQTTLEVYQQWLLLMLDLGYLSPECLARDTQRLWSDMLQKDVYDLNCAFAECLHLVRVQFSKGFKGLCSRVSSHLFHIVKQDVLASAEGNVEAARRLVQCFSYTSRLSLNDIDLTQQMLDDYLGIEGQIRSEFPDNVVLALNKIIRGWFGPFEPATVLPHHAKHGVAHLGRCSMEEKYKDLSYDQKLTYAYGSPVWVDSDEAPPLQRVSQTIFVPKSFKTFRTISMEPSTLQYFQQGVWDLIDRQVAYNPYLANRVGMHNPKLLEKLIGFHEQERNRKLALEGSIFRNFATIDLSSASDSVSYALVKRLFRGTWLLRHLVATRSTHTLLPDGRIVELKKFAPMGSSLCFPIETIIFASICDHVTRVNRVPGRFSVFGDDIIVPTQCAESAMRILTHLGFTVNRDKSFYDSNCWFRESCGGEYCNGYDVTPMRVSRKYAHKELDVRLTQLIDLANAAYQRGFRNLRYFFINRLRVLGYVPAFSPTSLLADNYTNYHTKKRWNNRLQRIEVQATTLVSRPREAEMLKCDEKIRYRHWLESTVNRSAIGLGFQSVTCRTTVHIRRTWVVKPYELSDQEFIDLHSGRANS